MEECGFDGTKNAIDSLTLIKEEVDANRPDLVINKVPKKDLRIFKDLAKGEFNGDYGMCLKFLVMYFMDDRKIAMMHERISMLEAAVYDSNAVEAPSTQSTTQSKSIKMLDGTDFGG